MTVIWRQSRPITTLIEKCILDTLSFLKMPHSITESAVFSAAFCFCKLSLSSSQCFKTRTQQGQSNLAHFKHFQSCSKLLAGKTISARGAHDINTRNWVLARGSIKISKHFPNLFQTNSKLFPNFFKLLNFSNFSNISKLLVRKTISARGGHDNNMPKCQGARAHNTHSSLEVVWKLFGLFISLKWIWKTRMEVTVWWKFGHSLEMNPTGQKVWE